MLLCQLENPVTPVISMVLSFINEGTQILETTIEIMPNFFVEALLPAWRTQKCAKKMPPLEAREGMSV